MPKHVYKSSSNLNKVSKKWLEKQSKSNVLILLNCANTFVIQNVFGIEIVFQAKFLRFLK